MSDEQPYYGVTIQTTINGDSFNFRSEDAAGMKKLADGLAEHGDDITSGLSAFKQVYLAKGVFTGTRQPSGAKANERKADSRPPSGGGAPVCDHGPMKDFGDKYRHRYYCPQPRDATDKCPPRD